MSISDKFHKLGDATVGADTPKLGVDTAAAGLDQVTKTKASSQQVTKSKASSRQATTSKVSSHVDKHAKILTDETDEDIQ